MTWYHYGLTPSDWTFVVNVDGITPNLETASLTAWNQPSSGTQLQISLASDGSAAVDAITSSDGTDGFTLGTVPEFYVESPQIWIDGGAGFRMLMPTTDAGILAAQATSDIDGLQNAQTSDEAVLLLVPVMNVAASDGSYSVRPSIAGGRVVIWRGPNAPGTGTGGAVEGDEWQKTPA